MVTYTAKLYEKQTQQNDLSSLTDPNKPITTDLCHLSLLANTIMAKLTNQCTQTGLSTFDWQQPFTWLWWWLLLRLSKRQSPLPTTVLLRTTLTRTIKLHYYMLPWVQTIYCKIIYSHNSKQRKPGYWLTSFNFEGSRYREIDIVNSYN